MRDSGVSREDRVFRYSWQFYRKALLIDFACLRSSDRDIYKTTYTTKEMPNEDDQHSSCSIWVRVQILERMCFA